MALKFKRVPLPPKKKLGRPPRRTPAQAAYDERRRQEVKKMTPEERRERFAPKENFFHTEKGREHLRRIAHLGGKKSTRAGIPNGSNRTAVRKAQWRSAVKAKEVVAIMVEKYAIEDDYAKEALETSVEIMRTRKSVPPRERLAAARLVLDFCKQKPASKSDVTVSKAEDFLQALLDEGAEKKVEDET
jgi:hypothetical protein